MLAEPSYFTASEYLNMELKVCENLPIKRFENVDLKSEERSMTISGISSMPSPAATAPVSTTRRPAAKTATASATATASSGATSSQSSTASASSTAASGKGASHGPDPSQSTPSSAQKDTVAGKSYSGSVVESDGEYEASVPNLPGASASGSSIESAENNLAVVIDTLA
jgi:hypothetical protein